MEAYRPKPGETVRVELYGEVYRITESKKENEVSLVVKLNERGDTFIAIVPLVAVEPFNPERAMEDQRFA